MAGFDVEFVRSLRAGEAGAFEALVRELGPRVRRMAMFYFSSPFDQEEAVQETFLLVHRQREAVDPLRADALGAFVATLARRRMIDLLRSRRLEPPTSEVGEGDWVEEGDGPEEAARRTELAGVLEKFEAKLKPAYRAYFHAVFVEGKDFDEARGSLGLGVLRAKYLKRVLLSRLRRHLPLRALLGLPEGSP